MRKPVAIILGVTALLLCLGVFSITQGKYSISLETIWEIIRGNGNQGIAETVLFNIRLPRILGAMLIGAAMAASGASYQSIFVNPLVSPGILGVLSGAGFGAALGMVIGDNWFTVQILAFGFGMTAAAVAIMLSHFYQGDRVLMLLLGGIISSSMFTALLSLIKYLADPDDELPAITYWLMGGLSMVTLQSIMIVTPLILGGLGILIILSGRLNLLSMGDDEARTLGVHPGRLRVIVIAAATLTCVASVSIGGIIGWIGLLTPHIGRFIAGPDNRVLIPLSAVIGAILLLLADNLSRLYLPVELPLGITTSLFGIPFFAFCLKRARRGAR